MWLIAWSGPQTWQLSNCDNNGNEVDLTPIFRSTHNLIFLWQYGFIVSLEPKLRVNGVLIVTTITFMQCMYQNLIKKKIDVDIKEKSVRSNLRVRMLFQLKTITVQGKRKKEPWL